jgi:uncharacterized membrane protein
MTTVAREAAVCAGLAAIVAAVLAWLGPPGADFAAHAYQRSAFLQHGFALWNNFWYAGRYSFVTYSLIYYPLAAVLGIKLLGVASVAASAFAFAWQRSPRAKRSSGACSRTAAATPSPGRSSRPRSSSACSASR